MNATATQMLGTGAADIARAATLLSQGRLVAMPTETVYGLAADACNDAAVAAIYAAKGRPSSNPLIVHVSDLAMAGDYVDFTPIARDMAQAFWPGPLTLVLPLRSGTSLSDRVTAGLSTLAVRMPETPAARALIQSLGRPLAAPSANPSGKVSPTTAAHVMAGLGGKIAAIIDAGPCQIGLESTIIGFEGGPTLLRPGGLPHEAIERMLDQPLRATSIVTDRPNAPGQLASHYAPDAALRMNATSAEPNEVLVGFGPIEGTQTLSASGDLAEAAACLFDRLRSLDATGATRIAVAPIPDKGLGRAINDRLRRAAAPRD